MKKIEIHPSIESPMTEVYFGEGILNSSLFKEKIGEYKGKVVLVVDSALKELYGIALAKEINAELLTIPSGAKAKSRETEQKLIDQLFKMGAGRDTLLIALGGGATTDLVGFVASTYMRGVPLILIPTTLLGIVDASIGGKTAIDTPFGKNLIGSTYPPKAIFADLDLLKTLSEKEKINGFAEILKMGLIYDSSIWEMAQVNREDFEIILKAIQAKISVIEQDPKERGLRRILNFGHTIGHALETIANYEMPHGVAVLLGSLVEANLSMHLGYLSEDDFKKIEKLYRTFSLKLPIGYTREKLFQAMTLDKKNVSGKVRFVLMDRIGQALPFEGNYCRQVDPNELELTLDWMETTYG